jgi:hypothetical protein
LRSSLRVAGILGLGVAVACGPHPDIPPRPVVVPGALAPTDSGALLAHRLAPLLYLQRDEWFPLDRAVAVLHPTRPIIAYHLLWHDDVMGSWIPFTVPTDEEVIWIGYSPSGAPTDMWTYWHGKILHTDWRDRGTPAVDVQWGKHGSLPRGIIESDLPLFRKLNTFYAFNYLLLPDILLGKLTRPGPSGFFHSYARYRDFSRLLVLSDSLDVVVRARNPRDALTAVFGKPYSEKTPWPRASAGSDSVRASVAIP